MQAPLRCAAVDLVKVRSRGKKVAARFSRVPFLGMRRELRCKGPSFFP
jgi:hypothetical protein